MPSFSLSLVGPTTAILRFSFVNVSLATFNMSPIVTWLTFCNTKLGSALPNKALLFLIVKK